MSIPRSRDLRLLAGAAGLSAIGAAASDLANAEHRVSKRVKLIPTLL